MTSTRWVGRRFLLFRSFASRKSGDFEILGKILEGGQAAMNDEGVVVIGGHSVDDQEMKFGYAVTGIVHPERVISNAGAKPGDVLILTKPIGTGAINTAVKNGKAQQGNRSGGDRCDDNFGCCCI